MPAENKRQICMVNEHVWDQSWWTKRKTNRRIMIQSALALQARYLGWGKIDKSKWLGKNHDFIKHSTRIPDKSVTNNLLRLCLQMDRFRGFPSLNWQEAGKKPMCHTYKNKNLEYTFWLIYLHKNCRGICPIKLSKWPSAAILVP